MSNVLRKSKLLNFYYTASPRKTSFIGGGGVIWLHPVRMTVCPQDCGHDLSTLVLRNGCRIFPANLYTDYSLSEAAPGISYCLDDFSSLSSLYRFFFCFGLGLYFINREDFFKSMKNFDLNTENLELKLFISYFDSQYLKSCAYFHSLNGGGGFQY